MLEIPVIRWGEPYESMEQAEVVHFETAEPMAKIHQANGGLVKMDMRKAHKARKILREFSIDDLVAKCEKAAELYTSATLPLGNGTQSPDEFCRIQSATTGLPEHMCRFNMTKNAFVLGKMGEVLDALTRGLPHEVMSRGYGKESRGVTVSYQAQSPVLGAVLPNNSPGVHTLWLPVIPLQMGLVLKPGSQEPWTPYRIMNAFIEAGIPKEVFCMYPGPRDVGTAVMEKCERSMIFGSAQTVASYHGDPRTQAHGPGFSKILIGEDEADNWEQHLDVMADSIFKNSGRSCISASGVWTPRHGKEIAEALAERLGPIAPLPMTDENAALAAFTTKGVAEAMNNQIDQLLKEDSSVTEVTAKYRDGDRLVEHERYDFLRPTILHCPNPESELANTEYMFPFGSVVECPQDQMIKKIGTTLVGTAITNDESWIWDLTDATNIDRLNIGPIPTLALNWLQPHEGNLIEFLFRARAVQTEAPAAH